MAQKYRYDYGLRFPGSWTKLDVELYCLRTGRTVEQGGLGKAEHWWKIVNLLWGPGNKVHNTTKYFCRNPWSESMIAEACQEKYIAVGGAAGSTKCLSPKTKVLRYDGSICCAEDVKVGDQLMGDDSTSRTVLRTAAGTSEMYKIIPRGGGEIWECNADHILVLKRVLAGPSSRNRIGDIIEISVQDYLAKSTTFKRQYRLYQNPVVFNNSYKALPIEPRLYGLWLGDGITKDCRIVSSDLEIEVNNYLLEAAQRGGYVLKKNYYGKIGCADYRFSRSYRRNPFLRLVRSSTLSGKKRIDERYLKGPLQVRLELLAGIVDSDGHMYKNKSGAAIACSNSELAQDIVYLARSLGFRVASRPGFAICSNNGKKCPTTFIRLMGSVGSIPTLRKKGINYKYPPAEGTRPFSIEAVGTDKWTGFTVDGNGRFLLGDFTVTHNSETFALWLLVNYLADARNTLCLIVTTSLTAARGRIWGSLTDFITAVPHNMLPMKILDSVGVMRYESPTFKGSGRSNITLVAAERKQEKEAVTKLMGFHQKKVLLVADELSELPESILEYALPGGNLSSNPEYQFIGLSNPFSYFDSFGKLWKPKEGWLSVTVDDDRWETQYGVGLHFDGTRSPNCGSAGVIYTTPSGIPYLPWPTKIAEARASEGGENTVRFWRMIRGFVCPIGSEDLIYSQADIVKFKGDEPAVWGAEALTRVAALDPGFTNGGDRTILMLGTFGQDKLGQKVLQFDRHVELTEDVTNTELDRSYQIAYKLKEICEKEGVSPYNCAIDSTGAGSPFCDVVGAAWSRDILRVHFGGKASDLPVSLQDPTPSRDRYADRVSEIWYSAKELLRQGQIKGIYPALAAEMVVRQYGTTGALKKVYAESKRDMKLRMAKSPDIADSGFVLVTLCRERLGLAAQSSPEPILQGVRAPKTWSQIRASKAARLSLPTNLGVRRPSAFNPEAR